MAEPTYRDTLPQPLPGRLRALPVQDGWPVPWFVAPAKNGRYDFRLADSDKRFEAVTRRRCWICGGPLGARVAFVIGPMCLVNLTTSEPASHRDCAEWATLTCPFMVRPEHVYRRAGLPAEATASGTAIDRNPGVTGILITRGYRRFGVGGGGWLIHMEPPLEMLWRARGRDATRAEVEASIKTGLPVLQQMAEAESPAAIMALIRMVTTAMAWLPAD